MSKEAMKLALEAFEAIPEEVEGWIPSKCTDAIIALKQALEQPEPKPIAWTDEDFTELIVSEDIAKDIGATVPLYALPPKREWQGLTNEEIDEGQRQSWVDKQAFESAAWWAEAKLKEKNSGLG